MNPDTSPLRRSVGLVLGAVAVIAAGLGTMPADARAPKTPDIRIASVQPTTAQTEAGRGLTVRAVVRNSGGSATRAGAVTFALSKDRTSGKDVRLRPDVPVPALDARGETVLPPTLDVPPKTSAGSYYVIACAHVPGKDGTKGNDCLASTKRVRVNAPIRGDLTGQIVFDRATHSGGSDWTETTTDHATVSVDVRVDGREKGWDIFANAGSTWDYEGSSAKVSHPSSCEVTVTGSSLGSGTLRQTGDQYEDDLLGAFKLADHSRIDLLIGLRYDHTVRTTQKPTDELGCRPEDTTDGPRQLRALTELDLRQVQRTKKSIVYKVVGATDPYSTGSEWDTVTGKLTLELG